MVDARTARAVTLERAFQAALGGGCQTAFAAHVTLVEHADLVFAHFRTLPPRTQALVRKWVEEMAMGMKI